MAKIWLEKLAGSARQEFLMAVRNLEKHWAKDSHGPTAATACSGTDIMRPVVEQIALELEEQFGVKARVKFLAAAEIDVAKREFFKSQHDHELPCQNHEDLAKSRTFNAISGKLELVPHFDILGQGVVCKSATPLSSNRTANENCVAEGRSATGKSFEECLAVIDNHWPAALTLECVKEFARETADEEAEDKSNALYMASQLEARGYWVMIIDVEALDWGAPARRRRLYWVGLRGLGLAAAPGLAAKTFFTKMLNAFRCPQALTPADCMISQQD